jgi:shikimate kinase
VLATGGGAVTQAPNRKFLKQRGIVVYLYTPVELQLQRTYRDKNRPLLQVENPEQKLRDLLKIEIHCIVKLHIILLKQIKVLHEILRKNFATYSIETS